MKFFSLFVQTRILQVSTRTPKRRSSCFQGFFPLVSLLVLLHGLIFPLLSQSYLLRTRTLLHKMASQGGKGSYEMQQKLHFYHHRQKVELEEHWWWNGQGSLRAHVFWRTQEGERIFLVDFIYQKNQKIWHDKSKTSFPKRTSISPYFMDRLWFSASTENLLDLLVQWGVLPAEQNLLEKPAKKPTVHVPVQNSQKNKIDRAASWNYDKEPFVSLQIKDKAVYYLLCTSSPKCAEEKGAQALWVDQDDFFMKTLQLSHGFRLEGFSFQKGKKNLFFPRKKKWVAPKVEIYGQVLWVRPFKGKKEKKWFELDGLKTSPLFSYKVKKKMGSPYKLVSAFYKKMR